MFKRVVILISVISLSPVLGGQLTNDGWDCEDGTTWTDRFICDGYSQCDDDSDEGTRPGEGCNLYPESGCPSHEARRRWRCQRTGECWDTREQAETCETSTEPASRDCTVKPLGGEESPGWKCVAGSVRCVELDHVCDGVEHCDDGSDEGTEPRRGCNLFPNYTDTCTSWGGLRHVSCPAHEATCIPVTMLTTINNTDPSTCHVCPDPGMWRCDSGQCINGTLRGDGVPDCGDLSDETPLNIYWYTILVTTIVIVLFGLVISLLFRLWYRSNLQSCFHCDLCSSSRTNQIVRLNSVPRADEVDCGGGSEDDDSFYPDSDIPRELIDLLDDKLKNWDLVERDKFSATMSGSKFSPSHLKTSVISEAKKKYLLIKMDTIQYHHLYMYLANRYATVKDLGKVTKHLLDWEKELHGESKIEVIKFWRLHLGTTDHTRDIINSVADENNFADRCEELCYPIRTFIRNCRRKILQLKPLEDGLMYRFIRLSYSALVPFIEGCFFYAERLKNLIYIHIFWIALQDLSKEGPMEHPFEFSLVLLMCLSVALTQFLFLLYSIFYAEEIFEYGHEDKCEKSSIKKILLKCFAALTSPFLPILVLANHIYYDSTLTRKRRQLQTFKTDDSSEDPVNPAIPQMSSHGDINHVDEPDEAKKKTQFERIKLYKLISKLETKSLLYRKLYSYFRVTSAVLESCTLLVCLMLLMFVTGRTNRDTNIDNIVDNRDIRLIVGVEHRLYNFFNVDVSRGLVSELNLMRDIVMLGSIIYSLAIILTALVKYWYQSKNLSISLKGQYCLGLYMLFVLTNKLTTIISLFATTQPLKFDNKEEEPQVTLLAAVILFAILTMIRISLVYVYKRFFSAGQNGWERCRKGNLREDSIKRVPRGWKMGDMVDKWVNVLINTVVVTPFMVQKQPLEILKSIEKEFNFSPEMRTEKRNSLRKRNSIVKINPDFRDRGNEIERVETVGSSGLVLPNMNFFVAPMLYDDLREQIRNLWWEDPTTKLTVAIVRSKLSKDMNLRMTTLRSEDVDQNIKITLEHLEDIGLINKPLLNPVPTMREYFWLFMIVALENLIALGIELINGGVWTQQGHYYSWDIRLLSLSLSLVFLITYYKRYHMTRDLASQPVCGGWLNYLPVCCCCWPDTALAAPANEMAMERVMSMDNMDHTQKTFRDMTTQTDFGPYSAFPPQSGDSGSEASAASSSRTGKKMSFSKSLNNMLSFDVKFNWANKAQPLQEEPKTPSSEDTNSSHAPLASQEALDRSLLASPNNRRNKSSRSKEDEHIKLMPKREGLLDQMAPMVEQYSLINDEMKHNCNPKTQANEELITEESLLL